MLIHFSVENYLSIKKKCYLSFEPSSDKEHPENLISNGKNRALKMVAVYGANASGKTSLINAFTASVIMIRSSNLIQIGSPLPVIPFKFDPDCLKRPSSFEYEFIAGDNQKYIYGFSATREKIIEEYLYCYKTSKPSLVFERTDTNHFVYTQATEKDLKPRESMNLDNKLFLATATSFNSTLTRAAYEWFANSIETTTGLEGFELLSLEKYRQDKDRSLLAFTEKLMKLADINISSINFEVKEMTNDEYLRSNQNPIDSIAPAGKRFVAKIKTSHIINDNSSFSREYELNLQEESDGTRRIFYCAPLLYDVLTKGGVLVIDEIDRSLHPFIVKFLVNIFRSEDMNPNGAQLVMTTHDTSLLSLDTFRRDQIYFTEKDNATGITDLYSLDEFSVRKSENIEKGYLLGRYGAIPYLHAEELITVG